MFQIIGITGLISSGKTTLSNYLKTKNYKIFEADFEVKKLYEDINFLNKLKDIFYNCFKNNILDKNLLSNIIFNDKDKKKILENIIHPIIEKKCDLFIKNNQNEKIIFIDIPLLFEVGWDKKCNKIILITINRDIQKKRYMERGGSVELFEKILKNQTDIEYKKNKSDFIIENNESIESFYSKIDNILANIKQNCKQ